MALLCRRSLDNTLNDSPRETANNLPMSNQTKFQRSTAGIPTYRCLRKDSRALHHRSRGNDKFLNAATFKEESVEEMLTNSSDEDEEELLVDYFAVFV